MLKKKAVASHARSNIFVARERQVRTPTWFLKTNFITIQTEQLVLAVFLRNIQGMA